MLTTEQLVYTEYIDNLRNKMPWLEVRSHNNKYAISRWKSE